MPRFDSRLQALGAEFLVLGQMLIQGMQCYKSYVNYPGYDLVAVNPANNKALKIQVKSRWATDFNKSFPIHNFECDFVVLVALNRGVRYRKTTKSNVVKDPEYYVFPVDVVKKAQKPGGKWEIVQLAKIEEYGKYLNRWDLINNQLK